MSFDPELAKKRWQLCVDYYSSLYADMSEDWEFLHGIGQWDDKSAKVRKDSGRPCLVLNQLLPYALQVTNDIRQSRLAIRVTPVDDQSDPDTAEVFSGIIRNVEVQSSAQSAYVTAALNAIGAGIGWYRITTDYADPMSFDQEIFVERVLDFTSVYLDPSFKKIDGSDAEYAFVRKDYTKEEFESLYPDARPVSFEESVTDGEICVVEYFERCYTDAKIYRISLPGAPEQIITDEQKDILDEDGSVVYEVLEERNTKLPYIMRYVLNGEDEPIEEDEVPCEYIPIVPVIGNEVFINNRREFHSLIRQGKDGQRMYNYWKSASTEFIALQPKAPWTGPVGSFSSYPDRWASANTQNIPTLEYDIVYNEDGTRAEPPQRAMPIQGSPAMMQEAMNAREDIRLAIGMPQSNMGERGGEVSGIAIRNRQVEGDNATYHFVDNLASSITHGGRILVSMIPKIYGKKKIMRVLGEGDKERNVPVNQPFTKSNGQLLPAKQGDKIDGIYRLDVGKYDVVCDVGASYSSKRQETADKLIQLVQAKPEIADITADLLFEALDLPMAKEIAKRIKATLDPALLGEDPMESKLKAAAQTLTQLQDQLLNYEAALKKRDENVEFEQNVKLKEIELKREQLAIDAQKTAAEIEKMRAETKGFNMEAVAALGNAVQGIALQVNDIGEALNIMLDAKESEGLEGLTSEAEDSDATTEVENENE